MVTDLTDLKKLNPKPATLFFSMDSLPNGDISTSGNRDRKNREWLESLFKKLASHNSSSTRSNQELAIFPPRRG